MAGHSFEREGLSKDDRNTHKYCEAVQFLLLFFHLVKPVFPPKNPSKFKIKTIAKT
jgi:hypothetical protein